MIAINREAFFRSYRRRSGPLTQSQVDGLNVILTAAETDPELEPWHRARDVGALAYLLATSWWESGDKFQPVREVGRGRGKPYGVPVRVAVPLPGSSADPYVLKGEPEPGWTVIERTFYGRALVQITWFDNYLHMGKELSIGSKLVLDPDLALDPAIAYRLLSVGVVRGCYRRPLHRTTLAQFVPPGGPRHFVEARALVNGTDHAADIAREASALVLDLNRALEAA